MIVSTYQMLASVIVLKCELCNNIHKHARIIFYVFKCNCLGEILVCRPTRANKGDGNKLLFRLSALYIL